MHLPPFKLEHYFANYEFKARYTLCGSDCETLSVHELLEMEESAWPLFLDHRLGYTETLGHPLLRKEITGLLQGMHPDQILVHTGAEEAIFTFMHAALQRGDHIIVHYPCYQSLYDIPRSIGCDVTLWTTREGDHWELDLDFLEDHLRPNTKVVVINFFARHQDCFHWQMPRAGPIAFPSLIEEEDVEQFCLELLTQAEVLLLPGTLFDEASRNFRIGFGRKNLPEGLERFERYLMHK